MMSDTWAVFFNARHLRNTLLWQQQEASILCLQRNIWSLVVAVSEVDSENSS
jgi:hypothetical protein